MRQRKRPIAIMLCVMLMCAMCIGVGSLTAFAHNETQVELDQWVDANGFRITYVAQGINRTQQLIQADNEVKYNDEIAGLYSRIKFDNIVGVDNWGKPIDFSKRFRFHVSSEQVQDWYVFDIASSTSASNVNAVQGHLTIGAGQDNYNNIEADSIVHFLNMQEDKETPSKSENNVRIDTARKGFATDNKAGDIPVGYLNEDGSFREYIYTFNFVSGDVESEKSTLTATTNADDEADVFYLTDTQKTLAGKKGYFSLFANGRAGWYKVKLVQEHTLTVNAANGYGISEINAGGNDVAVSNAPKIWGGDLVKMKLTGEDAILKVGSEIIIAGADGYWSFYMPDADTEISVLKSGGVYHAVTFDTNGGSTVTTQAVLENETVIKPSNPTKTNFVFEGWYADEELTTEHNFTTPVTEAVTLYAKWTALHTVTYKINGFKDLTEKIKDTEKTPAKTVAKDICPANGDRANGWKADNLSLTWYKDAEFTTEFDFDDPITEDTDIYGKLVETKQYKNTNAYGWDALTNFADDNGTQIIQSAFYATPFDVKDDGSALFMMTLQQEAVFSRALDVTRDIFYNVKLTATNGAWFISALWDNLTLAQIAYSDNYKHEYGVKASFGLDTVTGAILPCDGNFGSTGALPNAVDGGEYLKISIGENEGESAIFVWKDEDEDWVKLADLDIVRSDFRDGKAYFSAATFLACEAELKVWQEVDVTGEGDGHGTVSATAVGGGSAVKVVATPDEGYVLDTVTVNGKAVTLNNKGFFSFDSYLDCADGIAVKATFKAQSNTGNQGGDDGNKPADEESDGGCGSAAGGFGAVGAAAAMLGAAGLVLVLRRKKAND